MTITERGRFLIEAKKNQLDVRVSNPSSDDLITLGIGLIAAGLLFKALAG